MEKIIFQKTNLGEGCGCQFQGREELRRVRVISNQAVQWVLLQMDLDVHPSDPNY